MSPSNPESSPSSSVLRLLEPFSPTTAEEWRAKVESDLRGADFDRALVFRTVDGLPIEPLYHPGNTATPNPPPPGIFPHVRGAGLPTGSGSWSIAQEVDHPDLDEANRRLHHDLGLGVDLVWLCFADRDGQGPGVRVETVEHMERLLSGVEPSYIRIHLDAGADGASAAALFLAWASQRGVPMTRLQGSFALDPVALLFESGALPGSISSAWDQAARLARYCLDSGMAPGSEERDSSSGFGALALRTDIFHRAGASPAQELAFGLASGVEAWRQLEKRGLSASEVARQTRAVHSVGTDLFLEIAKLRAWRSLRSRVLRMVGAEADASGQEMHLRASTVGATKVDPWVNLLRTATQTFIGAVAGADSIVAAPYDRCLGSRPAPADEEGAPATDHPRRVAINTQHVIAEEGYLARVADPAGGSWAIESLTDRLARAAWGLFREIEGQGGMTSALESGDVSRRITETVAKRTRDIDRRKRSIIGVSAFPNLSEGRPEVRTPSDAESAETAEDREARRRSWEDGPTVDWMDPGSWVRGVSSLGRTRLSEALWTGRSISIETCPPYRQADGFERLRERVEERAEQAERPRIFLANLGSPRDHRARSEFAAGLFSAAGIEAVSDGSFASEHALADAFARSTARAAVLCSSDALYPQRAPAAARALRRAGAELLYLAGRPGEQEEEYRSAGIDAFVHLGCDVRAILARLVDLLLDVEAGSVEAPIAAAAEIATEGDEA